MQYPSIASQMSDAELSAYSKEHLGYEIKMFFNTGVLLSTVQFPKNDDRAVTYKNALVESFATHLRNLLLFVYPYSHEEPDVISDYYFSDPITDWKQKRPKETNELREARQRASQEISHLTVFRREVDEDKLWPVPELMQSIKAVLQVFVDNAADTKLHPSVKNLLVDSTATSRAPLVFHDIGSTSPMAIIVVDPSATNHIDSVSLTIPSKIP